MTGQQLKNSILQMAVQGKLVPQDPNDEPAAVLLERIRAEKEQLMKEGKIKREKNPSVIFRGADNLPYEKVSDKEPVCIADEVPFEIPESWEWVRLRSLVSKEIKRGKSPKYTNKSDVYVFAQKCNVKQGGIDMSLAKYLDMSTFGKYPEEEYMRDGDIVINSTGNGTLGRIGVFQDADRIDENVIVPDSHVTVIRMLFGLDNGYIYNVLSYYQPFLEKQGEGSTNQTELKPAVIADLLIPMPPIEEQHRIDVTVALVSPYVVLYGEEEKQLNKYNSDFPDQLKKSILQEAIQGKLVPQDPNDEPASVLLERIRAEKEQLIREGKIKRDKHESVIFRRDNSYYEKVNVIERCIDDELPFEIPESWEWVRLSHIFSVLNGDRGKNYPAKSTLSTSGIPFISALNLDGKTVVADDNLLCMTEKQYNKLGNGKLVRGDVIVCIRGSLGKHGRYPFEKGAIASSLVILRPFVQEDTLSEYIMLWLDSPIFSSEIKKYDNGTAQPNLAARSLEQFFVPLPPIAEQQRIVNKINSILPHLEAL